jgi:hypothetical protein
VEHYNNPCAAHERQKPPCLQKYDEPCSIHTRDKNALAKKDEPVRTPVCPQLEAMMCCNKASCFKPPIGAMSPAEYSRWGKCQVPAHEIERQIREKREEAIRVKKQKEKEKVIRQILKEKKMELRPQCPPPHNMNHRAEVPCEHCTPSIPKEKPTYPATEYDSTPICPPMDRLISQLKRASSREFKRGVTLPSCNCIYDGLQDCCARASRK